MFFGHTRVSSDAGEYDVDGESDALCTIFESEACTVGEAMEAGEVTDEDRRYVGEAIEAAAARPGIPAAIATIPAIRRMRPREVRFVAMFGALCGIRSKGRPQ